MFVKPICTIRQLMNIVAELLRYGRQCMIAIIDYDAGNIKSVEKAIQFLGEEAVITRDPEKILSAENVILPGRILWVCHGRIRSYELEVM